MAVFSISLTLIELMLIVMFLQVSTAYASDFSVVMPGQQYPTYIAQPAPLPCQREGIYWPPHGHEHSFVLPQQI